MLRRLIGVLVLGMVVLASVQVVGAQGEVIWYWKDVDVSGFDYPAGHVFDKFMNTTELPQTATSNTITLEADERAWWYAHEAAQCDLTFPSGDWTFYFWAETNSGDSERIYPRVVKLYENGSSGGYITSASAYKSIKSADGIKEITYSVEGSLMSFQQGDRVAVEILASSGFEAGEWLKIYYNSTSHNSTLTSPSSSPAWPVPELSTLLLLSIGLITLAGYVLLTKWRK